MIFVDLDGVLVDFPSAAFRAHGRTCAVNEPASFDFYEEWGLNDDEFWEPIDRMGPAFWADIPEYPWARGLLKICGDQFCIATANARHPNSAAGKVVALQALFGVRFRDYVITPRKWLLGGPGRVLIDDKDANCERFEQHGGTSILFPQPWNANRRLCDRRLAYVSEQLDNAGVAL